MKKVENLRVFGIFSSYTPKLASGKQQKTKIETCSLDERFQAYRELRMPSDFLSWLGFKAKYVLVVKDTKSSLLKRLVSLDKKAVNLGLADKITQLSKPYFDNRKLKINIAYEEYIRIPYTPNIIAHIIKPKEFSIVLPY